MNPTIFASIASARKIVSSTTAPRHDRAEAVDRGMRVWICIAFNAQAERFGQTQTLVFHSGLAVGQHPAGLQRL